MATRQIRVGYNDNLKGYRYMDLKGKFLFDFDYPHGNILINHYHGIPGGLLQNRTEGHWTYLRLIWWLITGK